MMMVCTSFDLVCTRRLLNVFRGLAETIVRQNLGVHLRQDSVFIFFILKKVYPILERCSETGVLPLLGVVNDAPVTGLSDVLHHLILRGFLRIQKNAFSKQLKSLKFSGST